MTLIIALLLLSAACGGQAEGPTAPDEKTGVSSAGKVTEALRSRVHSRPLCANCLEDVSHKFVSDIVNRGRTVATTARSAE